jgi:hypothetical protein
VSSAEQDTRGAAVFGLTRRWKLGLVVLLLHRVHLVRLQEQVPPKRFLPLVVRLRDGESVQVNELSIQNSDIIPGLLTRAVCRSRNAMRLSSFACWMRSSSDVPSPFIHQSKL